MVRNSTSSPEAVGVSPVIAFVPKYAIRVARMKAMPPMVGVPFLLWCAFGPSSRMYWP